MIIAIDGVPGSGKTSLAKRLASAGESRGHATELWLETSQNHPINPIPADEHGAAWADIHQRITVKEFISATLDNWRALIDSRSDQTVILESVPFQSSLRVLIQMDAEASLIESFWDRWLALAEDKTKLVVLRVSDVEAHFRGICDFRGTDWSNYIHSAIASTPFAQSRGLGQRQAAAALVKDFSDRMWTLLSASPRPFLSVPGGEALDERIADQVTNWVFGERQANWA